MPLIPVLERQMQADLCKLDQPGLSLYKVPDQNSHGYIVRSTSKEKESCPIFVRISVSGKVAHVGQKVNKLL